MDKNNNNPVTAARSSTSRHTLSPTRRGTGLPSRFLDALFDRLHAQLGAKFLDGFNGADMEIVREEWSAALGDMKPVELQRGLAETAQRKFAPTLGEFALLCRPCLDPEWAFHEAEHCLHQRDAGQVGDWSHPAVWRAACEMSPEIRRGQFRDVRTRWTYLLKRELAKGWGEEPPAPPLQLSDGRTTRGPTEQERAKMREMLGSMTRGLAPKLEGDDHAA